jgi:Protein of unknown function (DUF1501)
MPPHFNRRSFLRMGAAGLWVPALGGGLARAASTASNRKFLFVHCYGGWDTTYVFQPNFGSKVVAMESDSVEAEVGNIKFVDNADRASVRTFLETDGFRTCIINGIEVRSVTHERCSKIIMTGSAEGDDDWGARISGAVASDYLLPYLVLSGQAFATEYSANLVRIGTNGQLGQLLDGSVFELMDNPASLPSETREAITDAFVRSRASALSANSPLATQYLAAGENLEGMLAFADKLELGGYGSTCEGLPASMTSVFDAFELGLARCALIEYRGWCSQGWDTHSDGAAQGVNFEELFGDLSTVLADLDTRTGVSGTPLKDEVTIVVLSEMGRTPTANSSGGKDHWTFTSAMLVGSGFQGDRVISGFDTNGLGTACDFDTGEILSKGVGVSSENFGATLLAMADIDPGESLPVGAVLT